MAQKQTKPSVTFLLATLQFLCATLVINSGNTALAGFIIVLGVVTLGLGFYQLSMQKRNDY